MKKIALLIISILIFTSGFAKRVYVSNSGSDSHTGLSRSQAVATLAKAETLLAAGDILLLERGDIWNESFTAPCDSFIVVPFGSGKNPIISGFTTLSGFTNTTGNIWVSNDTVPNVSAVNLVLINGVNTPMGREPDSGYYYYQSSSDNTHLTSSDLTGTPDWTGAEVAFNNNNWTTQRRPITGQSTGTLTFTNTEGFTINTSDLPLKFIIQSDSLTLDNQNEWYYNPDTKKLVIYSSGEPTDVKVSAIGTLVDVTDYDYITFKNITFEGSNDKSINIRRSNYTTVNNCTFDFSGRDAIYGGGFTVAVDTSANLTISNCIFRNANNGAVGVTQFFKDAYLGHNLVSNVGMIYGAGCTEFSGTNNAGGLYGLVAQGNGSTFEYNFLSNIGYNAIRYRGSNVTVRYNFVENFCQVNHDGGALYTYNSTTSPVIYENTKVYGNIIVNDSTLKEPGYGLTEDAGIYFDGITYGIEAFKNSIKNRYGIGFTVKGHFLDVHGNNIFDTKYGIKLRNTSDSTFGSITLDTLKIVTLFPWQYTYNTSGGFNVTDSLASNNNTIGRAMDQADLYLSESNYYNLGAWQAYATQDANTDTVKPKIVYPSYANADLFYNYSGTTTSVSLPPGTWRDVDSTAYSGSIELLPYSSEILIKDITSTDFGYNSYGTNTVGSYGDDIISMPVTFTENGSIQSITFYQTGSTNSCLVGVYSDNSSLPGDLLATSDVCLLNSTTGWKTVPLTEPLSVTSGTTVWLAVQASGAVIYRYSSGTGRSRSADNWTGSLPFNQDTPNDSSTAEVRMYCTYIAQ